MLSSNETQTPIQHYCIMPTPPPCSRNNTKRIFANISLHMLALNNWCCVKTKHTKVCLSAKLLYFIVGSLF